MSSTEQEKALEAVRAHAAKKEHQKAAEELRRLVDSLPDKKVLLEIARSNLRACERDDVLAIYDALASIYASSGDPKLAAVTFGSLGAALGEIGAELPPDAHVAYALRIAVLCHDAGMHADALGFLDAAGKELAQRGEHRRAYTVYRKALELDPESWPFRLACAEALIALGQRETAATELAKVGAWLLSHDREDDALRVLERLFHIVPRFDEALLCAHLYLRRAGPGDAMNAVAKLDFCFKADPSDDRVLELLSRAFEATGAWAKSAEVEKERARVARTKGDAEALREAAVRLTRLAPSDPQTIALAAEMGWKLGGDRSG